MSCYLAGFIGGITAAILVPVTTAVWNRFSPWKGVQ